MKQTQRQELLLWCSQGTTGASRPFTLPGSERHVETELRHNLACHGELRKSFWIDNRGHLTYNEGRMLHSLPFAVSKCPVIWNTFGLPRAFQDLSYRLGVADTRLAQLEAPKTHDDAERLLPPNRLALPRRRTRLFAA